MKVNVHRSDLKLLLQTLGEKCFREFKILEIVEYFINDSTIFFSYSYNMDGNPYPLIFTGGSMSMNIYNYKISAINNELREKKLKRILNENS